MDEEKKKKAKGAAGSAKKKTERDEKEGRRTKALAAALLLLILAAAVLLLRSCGAAEDAGGPPEYEDSAEYETDGAGDADPARLNIAVLPDYTVSAHSPCILIPYPKENANDIEFVFREKDSGREIYATKRIRPGTVVRADMYGCCKRGDNGLLVEVRVFDRRTWEEVPCAVALETTVTKQ
ncbi:MAG: hypothetical protein IJ682_04630 [Lachnospiraceae bacterium]|nr:hypothetical protein [Lachnospiraceae bacterium]